MQNSTKTYYTSSSQETTKLGIQLGLLLKPGDVVCLDGDLGAGKTHFTFGIGQALGITDYITSPTFTIINEYSGKYDLYHFDVYRILSSDEMFDIGFDEYLNGDGIVVIEWASLIEDILPKNRIDVRILRQDLVDLNKRIIEITMDERIEKIDYSSC